MLVNTRGGRTARVRAPEDWVPAVRCLGWLVAVDEHGTASVDFAGNTAGPLPARSAVQLSLQELAAAGPRPEVLLDFEASDARRPVIVGLVRQRLVQADPGLAATLRLDGRRVEVSAAQELVLQCGLASIELHADGRIVIRGGELQSRARGRNRIVGSTVAIN